jgi:hypothetical protein
VAIWWSALIAILLATTALPLVAQWRNYPDARTPRTKDGKPNLTAPAPRINGKPDLNGVWQAERPPESEFIGVLGNNFAKLQVDLNDITKEAMDVLWGLKSQEEPLRPDRFTRTGLASPRTYSLPGWGTRWGIGKATRWWSTQWALAKRVGSICSAIPAQRIDAHP